MAATTSDPNALRARLTTASPAVAAGGASIAPAKPWEQRSSASRPNGSDASTSIGSTGIAARSVAQQSTSTADAGGLQATANSAYSTANTNQMNSNMAMNPNSSMAGYGNGAMGTTGYGATGYGATGYGTTGYGGMSSYGGGMGAYGGMGSYGGMGGMGMGGMDPNGQMGFLQTFSQTVGSLGQITEMLGMNAEALNFCIGSFVNFVERIGAMCAGMAAMVTPRPQFPPGHPMHGPPPTPEEEQSRKRRVRVFQFLLSMIALASLYKTLRWLGLFKRNAKRALTATAASSSRATRPPAAMTRNLERIFQDPSSAAMMPRGRTLLQ